MSARVRKVPNPWQHNGGCVPMALAAVQSRKRERAATITGRARKIAERASKVRDPRSWTGSAIYRPESGTGYFVGVECVWEPVAGVTFGLLTRTRGRVSLARFARQRPAGRFLVFVRHGRFPYAHVVGLRDGVYVASHNDLSIQDTRRAFVSAYIPTTLTSEVK